MTGIARIGYTQLLCLCRRDESKCVRANKVVLDRLLDFRHVASNALAARASLGVVSVFAYRAAQSRSILFVVTKQAKRIARHGQIRWVRIAVNLVAIKTSQTAMVHVALDKVVALHPVLVRSHVGILIKARRSQFCRLERPIIG